jgi:hypothetical protein
MLEANISDLTVEVGEKAMKGTAWFSWVKATMA